MREADTHDHRPRAVRPRPDDGRAAPSVHDRFDVDLSAPAAAARLAADATARDRLAADLLARADGLSSVARVQRGRARDDDDHGAALREDADTADRRADGVETRDSEAGGGAAPATTERAVAADAQEAARVAYDSGARRDAWAADLERRGLDRTLAAARVRADVSQGRPATQVPDAPPRATVARTRRATLARTRTASRAPRTR